MIAVIADDFTGAAEIGGIGLRHGLKVIIETRPILDEEADLLVVATDTRSLKPDEAAKVINQITEELLKINPQCIFKKLDSVLRGNIIGELAAQMKISNKSRVIIAAANPIFNRIIRDGIYYIDDIPLNKTCFATDCQFPIRSSNVLEIINKNNDLPLVNLKPDDELPDSGYIIGDVCDFEDLDKWAGQIDNKTLLAGASGFFNAILEKQKLIVPNNHPKPLPFGKQSLFVLGSTYPKDIGFLEKLEENGHYLSNMPKEIYFNKNFNSSVLDSWVKDIVEGIFEHNKVITSIVHTQSNEPGIDLRIRKIIGELIKKVVELVDLEELFIEGGSTTYLALKCLDIKKLYPIQELDTGVIRMKTDCERNFCITTKPGSYFWPDDVWVPKDIQRFNNIAYD
ncbi:four-carbon acid sugar kinase family protein [Bacteroidota bacterium]